MSLRPEHTIRRKMSHMSILDLSRSMSAIPSSESRPSTPLSATNLTPQSSRRRKSWGFRQLLGRYQSQEPEFEMLRSPSRSVQTTPPAPQISKLAKAFVDSLNARQLSDFLIWMLYHEFVELPEHPDTWYGLVDSVDMRGWVALGEFLSKFSMTMDTAYGFDIVVMDSICDRLQLQRSTVHGLIMQFADSAKMAFSQIATLVNAANAENLSEIEVLEIIQSKLREYHRLVARLTPTEGSICDDWRAILLKQLHSFLRLVISPRIASYRSGVPVLTAATSEQLPQEVKDSIRLKYLFELVQQKRWVTLSRYGIYPEIPSLGLTTPPSSPPDMRNGSVADSIEAERARKHAIQLMAQNHDLRAQVASLQQGKEKLQDSNAKLAHKVAALARNQQPLTYSQSLPKNIGPHTPSSHASIETQEEQDPNYLQVPNPHNRRPRSLSHDTGTKLATTLDQNLNQVSNHKRQRSEVLSWRYEDVFEPLDTPPSPPVRLSDPATGELLQPSASSLAAGAGRRSGMVFSNHQMDLLKGIRDETPSSPCEGDGGVRPPTPTPSRRWGFWSH